MVSRSSSRSPLSAFTLLEVVLAISLSTVLLLILMMAIHQFLYRTDASHGETETTQLARALLNQMANDLRAARFSQVTSGEVSTGQASRGQTSTNSPDASTSPNAGTGIVGTATEIRIEQSAMWRWEPVPGTGPTGAPGEAAEQTGYRQTVHPPQTVRYFLREGDEMSTAQLAKRGSQETPADSIAGLCYERWQTTQREAQTEEGQATTESQLGSKVELLAPEVLELKFAYADDTGELVDQWNSAEQGALPRAVEIVLTLRKNHTQGPPDTRRARGQASLPDGTGRPATGARVNYRLLVELPDVQLPRSPTLKPSGKSTGSSRSAGSADATGSRESSNSGGDSSPPSGSERGNER